MFRKTIVFGLVLMTSFMFLSGCSFNLSRLASILPSREKPEAVSKNVYQDGAEDKDSPASSREALRQELNGEINLVVDQIMAGKWNEAISIGEASYEKIQKEQQENPAAVSNSVYDTYGFDAAKEKLYEVLTAAYDFKYHLEGLNDTEKERYVRTAQAHFDIDTSDPFKKLALAKALTDTGDLDRGLRFLSELYNSQYKDKDITESYAWALYLSGQKEQAYNIYRVFYPQSETLIQLFHSAQVIEEKDKALGLNLYNGVIGAANNLMVKEPNVNNMSAQTYIDLVRTESRNASERLLAGGFRLNSQYDIQKVDLIVKSIVKLSGE